MEKQDHFAYKNVILKQVYLFNLEADFINQDHKVSTKSNCSVQVYLLHLLQEHIHFIFMNIYHQLPLDDVTTRE
jgi:hypothetical protein